MPHSPRVYDGRVYALLSLLGALVVVDPAAGTYDEVARVPGFVRGLARHGDYVFIGMSNELGAAESGLAAWLVGTVPAIVGGGAIAVLVTAAVAVVWRDLARMPPLAELKPPDT